MGRKGYTLVETMVAMLLVAMIVTSVFSMVLSSKMASVKTGSQAQAHFYARQQMEKLKAYVSADLTAPGPTANWTFPGDSSGGYALSPGVHVVTANLPADLQAAGWTMSYTVADSDCGGKTCKQVNFNVYWPGP